MSVDFQQNTQYYIPEDTTVKTGGRQGKVKKWSNAKTIKELNKQQPLVLGSKKQTL
jgi:hypothetical protein